jgi:hypothetical protein
LKDWTGRVVDTETNACNDASGEHVGAAISGCLQDSTYDHNDSECDGLAPTKLFTEHRRAHSSGKGTKLENGDDPAEHIGAGVVEGLVESRGTDETAHETIIVPVSSQPCSQSG